MPGDAPHQSKSHISESEQVLLKKSRDDKYEVLVFEKVREMPTSTTEGTLYRESVDGNEVAMVVDDTTTADVIYQGWAAPATATSAALWKIRKIDVSSGAVITWADGDINFDNEWDDRASLNYS